MGLVSGKSVHGISRRNFITALAGLPLLSLPWSPANAAGFKPFSFVYLTDAHLVTGQLDNGFKLLQESSLFLQETIKSINALNPDFVIFGGDQVETVGINDANWQLFIDIVQSLSAPWSFVLGEQDISGKSAVDKMKEFGPDFKGRGATSSTPYWSMDPLEDVHLIGLDTSTANSSSGELDEKQLSWLKSDLASNKGKFTIVISHHPLLPPAPFDGGPPFDDFIVPNGSDAREILGESSDVRLVLSGHLYLNKIQLERDIYHVSSAGLTVYPCQYKFFKVNKDSITIESFAVPFPALVKKARKALAESSLASKINRRDPVSVLELFEGRAEDQNAILSLGQAKTIKELSRKQVKEDEKRRDEQLQKQAEAARNRGKAGKGSSPKKEAVEKDSSNPTKSPSADDSSPNLPVKKDEKEGGAVEKNAGSESGGEPSIPSKE